MKRRVIYAISFLLFASWMISACAAIHREEAKSTEDLLIAAGFTQKVPQSPDDVAKLQALKPLQMVRRMKDGQVVYVYPDPYKCQCAYVGTEKEYSEYKRLAVQQQIAQENLQAADEMQMAPGWGWW